MAAGAGTTSFVTVNSRDAEIHLTSSTAGNGIVTTQAFNPLTGLIENTNAGPSSSVAQFTYAFDTIGNPNGTDSPCGTLGSQSTRG